MHGVMAPVSAKMGSRRRAGAGASRLKTFLVVPCFNEAARLDRSAFAGFLTGTDVSLVFVDDGSTDATVEALESIGAAAPDGFALVVLTQNGGKAEAIRAGVNHALQQGAECIGYWDADLATPLAELEGFRQILAERPEVVLVLGSRVRRLGAQVSRTPFRHYTGRVFATIASLVLGLPVYDTQCGAKLFRVDEQVRAAFATRFVSRWAFDVELLARIAGARRSAGLPVDEAFYELPLSVWSDVGGSKLGLRAAARAGIDLLRIRRLCCRVSGGNV